MKSQGVKPVFTKITECEWMLFLSEFCSDFSSFHSAIFFFHFLCKIDIFAGHEKEYFDNFQLKWLAIPVARLRPNQ